MDKFFSSLKGMSKDQKVSVVAPISKKEVINAIERLQSSKCLAPMDQAWNFPQGHWEGI